MKKTDQYLEKSVKPGICRKLLRVGILATMILLLLVPVEASAAAKISKKKITILKGQTYKLKVKGTSKKVKWSSSKSSLASVNSSGVVKGKKAGTAVITAKVGKKKFTCKVTVRQPVTSVKLKKTSITLKKGKSTTLKATVKPTNAYKKTLTWKSSNSSIASVSSKGKVTAKKPGNAVITAKAKDGSGVFATCVVMVQGDPTPLTISETAVTLQQGEARMLSASGTYARVVWGSSNQAVAAVGADGTVIAVGAGKARITAMTKDGLQYAYCDVTVLAPEASPSAAAQEFLNIIEGYSQEIREQKAKGHLLGYSNSSALVRNTWADMLKDMTERGIGYTNCAHTIRLALREMGRLGEFENFWGADGKIHFGAGVRETLEKSCEIIYVNKSADQLFAENGLVPGDICIWGGIGHTNIYAGNKLWYDTGRMSSDGRYMTVSELKKAGVPEKTIQEDIANDHDFPDLSKNTYVFNSLGLKGINLGSVVVSYIIRLVK